ncbi:MAG: RnfABCDGE type electron transport complex subunit D [Pseudomonadales bacterium]|nr:RnfABCDGE type electron transport complex subunit D [Pseudomonadales bacterium]
MNHVLLALFPGLFAQFYYFGTGYLYNLAIALFAGLLCCLTIALAMTSTSEKALSYASPTPKHRFPGSIARKNISPILLDNSNWVTCVLVAIALPPNMPILIVTVAIVSALGLGKYIYGGLGQNIFNPAMVGYGVVLISFPSDLALWPPVIEGLSGATPLEQLKYNSGQTVQELTAGPAFGTLAGQGWEWINAAYLAGGLYLIYQRIIGWHIPVYLLASIILWSAAWYDMGSSLSLGSPVFHLFSGGIMLGAFFIATDPVTCPSSTRGKIYFGLLCGSLIFIIRSWGGYPDGIAFAVLLANLCVPLIDHIHNIND